MSVADEIQFVLDNENMDSPLFMQKSLMQGWVEELSGAGTIATVRLSGIGTGTIDSDASFASIIVGGDDNSGELSGIINSFIKMTPGGEIANLTNISAFVAGIVASTDDEYNRTLRIAVTDADGTNQASCVKHSAVSNPVTDIGGLISLVGLSWTIQSGTDLTDIDGSLQTTAGGQFYVYVSFLSGWD